MCASVNCTNLLVPINTWYVGVHVTISLCNRKQTYTASQARDGDQPKTNHNKSSTWRLCGMFVCVVSGRMIGIFIHQRVSAYYNTLHIIHILYQLYVTILCIFEDEYATGCHLLVDISLLFFRPRDDDNDTQVNSQRIWLFLLNHLNSNGLELVRSSSVCVCVLCWNIVLLCSNIYWFLSFCCHYQSAKNTHQICRPIAQLKHIPRLFSLERVPNELFIKQFPMIETKRVACCHSHITAVCLCACEYMQNGIEECQRCPNNTPSLRRRCSRRRLDDLHVRASVFREFKTSRRSRGPITCVRVCSLVWEYHNTIPASSHPTKSKSEGREYTHKFQSFSTRTCCSLASHFPSNPLAVNKFIRFVRVRKALKCARIPAKTHTLTYTYRSSRRVRQGIRRLLFIKWVYTRRQRLAKPSVRTPWCVDDSVDGYLGCMQAAVEHYFELNTNTCECVRVFVCVFRMCERTFS